MGSAARVHGPQQPWGPAYQTLASEGTTLEQASRLGDFETAPQVMGAHCSEVIWASWVCSIWGLPRGFWEPRGFGECEGRPWLEVQSPRLLAPLLACPWCV